MKYHRLEVLSAVCIVYVQMVLNLEMFHYVTCPQVANKDLNKHQMHFCHCFILCIEQNITVKLEHIFYLCITFSLKEEYITLEFIFIIDIYFSLLSFKVRNKINMLRENSRQMSILYWLTKWADYA